MYSTGGRRDPRAALLAPIAITALLFDPLKTTLLKKDGITAVVMKLPIELSANTVAYRAL